MLVLRADRDRHQRAQLEPLGAHAARAQPAAQAAGDDGQHDVVDGAAERVLDELEVREVVADDGEAAGAGRSARSAASPAPGSAPAQATSPMPSSASRSSRQRVAGVRRRAEPRRPASSTAALASPRTPRATSSTRARLGLRAPRLALVRRARRARRRGRTARSSGRRRRSPSTSAWWVLEISAKRPPSSPSTSHVSHSGLARSSRCESIRAASARSCSSAARRRQRGVAHVVLEVEARVVDPQRPAGLQRRDTPASGGSAGRGAAARGCG